MCTGAGLDLSIDRCLLSFGALLWPPTLKDMSIKSEILESNEPTFIIQTMGTRPVVFPDAPHCEMLEAEVDGQKERSYRRSSSTDGGLRLSGEFPRHGQIRSKTFFPAPEQETIQNGEQLARMRLSGEFSSFRAEVHSKTFFPVDVGKGRGGGMRLSGEFSSIGGAESHSKTFFPADPSDDMVSPTRSGSFSISPSSRKPVVHADGSW